MSPLRLSAEQKYSSNMPQQLLLLSVIKLLPSLSLHKVNIVRCAYKKQKSYSGVSMATAEHATSLRPELHRTAESWVRHGSRQLLWVGD